MSNASIIRFWIKTESCRFVQVCVTFLLPPGIKGLISDVLVHGICHFLINTYLVLQIICILLLININFRIIISNDQVNDQEFRITWNFSKKTVTFGGFRIQNFVVSSFATKVGIPATLLKHSPWEFWKLANIFALYLVVAIKNLYFAQSYSQHQVFKSLVYIFTVSKSVSAFVSFPWFKINCIHWGSGKLLEGVFAKFYGHNEVTSWRKTKYCQSNSTEISLIKDVWTPQSDMLKDFMENLAILLKHWALKNWAKFYVNIDLYCHINQLTF